MFYDGFLYKGLRKHAREVVELFWESLGLMSFNININITEYLKNFIGN